MFNQNEVGEGRWGKGAKDEGKGGKRGGREEGEALKMMGLKDPSQNQCVFGLSAC